jgi:predicted nucleic acid-binding protein
MKKVIIDASAVLAVLLNEPHRERILEATAESEAVSPETLPFEVANALSGLAKQRGGPVSTEIARAAFARFMDGMTIRLLPMTADDHRAALEIALELGLYSYDGYMLLAAQREGAALLTLDGIGKKPGLFKQAHKVGVRVVTLEK